MYILSWLHFCCLYIHNIHYLFAASANFQNLKQFIISTFRLITPFEMVCITPATLRIIPYFQNNQFFTDAIVIFRILSPPGWHHLPIPYTVSSGFSFHIRKEEYYGDCRFPFSLLLTCDAISWEVEGWNTVGDFLEYML